MCVLAVDVQVLSIAKYMSKLVHTTAYSYNVAKLSLKFQAAMFALCVYWPSYTVLQNSLLKFQATTVHVLQTATRQYCYMSCPCCMLSCVFNKHVIYNWTFNCPPLVLRNIFKNIFKSHLNAKCTFKWQVFSHFSRRHKTQRCSSSLYIKDDSFINAVHNIVLVLYKACFNLIYMWSASIQLMHAASYQEASDGSTLLTPSVRPSIAAFVLFKDWGSVPPIKRVMRPNSAYFWRLEFRQIVFL